MKARLVALALTLLGSVYVGLYALGLPVGPLWMGTGLIAAGLFVLAAAMAG